jgi:superfamily II DNA or RNA helicase
MLRDAAPPAPAKARRPYQDQAIAGVQSNLATNRSTLLVLPTGTGKTFTAAEIVKGWPGQVLWCAHRTELIDQARAELTRICGEIVTTEKAEQWGGGSRIVVASVQTLSGRCRIFSDDPDKKCMSCGERQRQDLGACAASRLASFARRHPATLIVFDEAHHAVSPSYRAIADAFPAAKVLGLTATPDRGDERAMGQVFDSVAFVYEIQDAIRDGHLCPIRIKQVTVEGIDLAHISTVAGDLNQGELDAVMKAEAVLHGIIAPNDDRDGLIDLAGDRRTISFWTSVDAAHRAAEIINRYRPDSARAIDGMTATDRRKALLNDHKAGRYQQLANVGVLTEGYDDPAVSCIAMCRPTKSRALYAQCAGRGLRPFPGKVDCLLLDFVGNSGKHRLVSALDILAGKYDDEVIEKARDILEAQGMDGMLAQDALDQAQKLADAKKAREAAQRLRVKVTSGVKRRVVDVNPFAFLGVADPEADERYAGYRAEATGAQRAALDKAGVKYPEGVTKRQASALLDGMKARREAGLCTLRQSAALTKRGVDNADALTFTDASRLMGLLGSKLKKGQWRFMFTPEIVASELGRDR